MDKEQLKRRIADRIDADDLFASQVDGALAANDMYWLAQLISDVVGFVIQVGSEVWGWVSSQFDW